MIPAPLVSGATSILHNINHTCQYPPPADRKLPCA
jgi:hypothetical protein